MAEYSAGAALAFDYNAANGTTGNFTPSGAGIALIAAVGTIEFGSKTINYCRMGGLSGTDLTRVGSDYSWNSTSCLLSLWTIADIAAATTNLASGWAAGYLQSCIAGAAFSGCDTTTPFDGFVENGGLTIGVSTEVASISIPGCTIGQRVAAIFNANSDNVVLSPFTEVTGFGTMREQSTYGTYLGAVVVEKVAESTTEELRINVNGSSSSTLSWGVRGFRVVNGAGASTFYNPLTGRGGPAALPLV